MRQPKDVLIEAVKQYASEHYNDGGWDVIVEAYDDEQIAEVIGRSYSVAGAIAKFRGIVSVFAERQSDAAISSGMYPADWDGDKIREWHKTHTGYPNE